MILSYFEESVHDDAGADAADGDDDDDDDDGGGDDDDNGGDDGGDNDEHDEKLFGQWLCGPGHAPTGLLWVSSMCGPIPVNNPINFC